MIGSIKSFKNEYASRYSRGVSEFLLDNGFKFVDIVTSTLAQSRRTIYIFGNGGSYAISKCMKYAIEEFSYRKGYKVRIETGVDVNRVTNSQEERATGLPFVEILEYQGADSRDLILLISGSGNSENLCEVARFAQKESIPVVGIIGSSKGKINKLLDSDRCFVTPVDDQQISEDIMQSLVYLFEMNLGELSPKNQSAMISSLSSNLEKVIKAFPEKLLAKMASQIVESFVKQTPIWVMGVGHSSLNMCAEHTAHNLYWDGIYQVTSPPPRFIVSTPTGANLTGISNDRRKNVTSHLMGFHDAKTGCAIIFATKADASLRALILELTEHGINSYILFTRGSIKIGSKPIWAHKTNLVSSYSQAGIAQIFGHIVGRIVRLKLLKTLEGSDASGKASAADFLINEDLAQRRLIDA